MTFDAHISQKDLKKYIGYMESGLVQKAIDAFIVRYIYLVNERYVKFIQDQLSKAETIIAERELTKIEMTITSSTLSYQKNLESVFGEFVGKCYTSKAFKVLGITAAQVREAIKRDTIKQFSKATKGALSQTPRSIKSQIRTIQKAMITESNRLDKKINLTKLLDSKTKRFSDMAKDFIKIKKEGQFVTYRNGAKVPVDAYSEMATRTTILNVERNAVEIDQNIKGRRVVEYYLRDNRPLKTEPREICKHILSRQFYGISIVALDSSTANILGAVSLESARADGAMGPNCRHSIRPVSKEYENRIEKILYFAENQVI